MDLEEHVTGQMNMKTLQRFTQLKTHKPRFFSPHSAVSIKLLFVSLPVPGLERVTGPLEEIALHDHTVGCVHIELQLGVIVGEVLHTDHVGRLRVYSKNEPCFTWLK